MKKNLLLIPITIFVTLMLIVPSVCFSAEKQGAGKMLPSRVDVGLSKALRDLWISHIFWVRNVVLMTKFEDMGAAKVAEEQVVQDAKDTADTIVPFCGKDAGDRFFSLLADHYGSVKEYMTAAFAGNKDGKNAAMENMNKNADEIATFLAAANPNWPKSEILPALAAHGGHHVAQIDAVHGKDFATEAKVWNAMKGHIYVIADVLTDGIVKQSRARMLR